jgi:hypothetical protein
MAYHWKADSRSEERRNSGGRKYESYTPGGERDRAPPPRDRYESYVPAGERDRAPPRQDSREYRDGKYPNDRDARNPSDHLKLREQREPPRGSRLDTNTRVPEGPKMAKMSTNSPSVPDNLNDEPKFKPMKSGKLLPNSDHVWGLCVCLPVV